MPKRRYKIKKFTKKEEKEVNYIYIPDYLRNITVGEAEQRYLPADGVGCC
jgi:hypothetical protein